jgi:hypothetical protein
MRQSDLCARNEVLPLNQEGHFVLIDARTLQISRY